MKNIDFKIISLNRHEAQDFMRKNELMGNVGLGVWHFGLVFNDSIVSAISYGTTCSGNYRGFLNQISKELNCKTIQLCRGATSITAPPFAPSKLISTSNLLISKKLGNLIIVAYADPEWREIGSVYQSCNSIYTGMTNPKGQSNYLINGEFLSGWQVRKKFGTRDLVLLKKIDPHIYKIPLESKHRYVFICGKRHFKLNAMDLIKPYALNYPKRDDNNLPRMY